MSGVSKEPYGPPVLIRYGTLEELTRGGGVGATEKTSFPISAISDRAAKERFEPVDADELLTHLQGLAIERWSYRGEDARHIGPTAQDFAATFGVGSDDHRIAVVDSAGVALAAIQVLAARVAELEEKLAERPKSEAVNGSTEPSSTAPRSSWSSVID